MSSKNRFLSSVELASGGSCASANYTTTTSLVAGVVPTRSASTRFRILGGFAATLDVDPAGEPWITAVTPATATTNGGDNLIIHGINLDRGSAPTASFAGKPGTVTLRRPEAIVVQQPGTTAPGRPLVTFTNNHGPVSLRHGVRILPTLESDPAPTPDTAFDLIFRGTQGDVVLSPSAPSRSLRSRSHRS